MQRRAAATSIWHLLYTLTAVIHSATANHSPCALVAEGAPATLTCPPGTLISTVSFATFGEFNSSSSCSTALVPTAACPTIVRAQAELLCQHRASCTLSCDCTALREPPCQCRLSPQNLTTAFPAWPCSGVPKSLGLRVTCTSTTSTHVPQPDTVPTNLLLEFMPTPVLGLDQRKPHFSWTPPTSQQMFRVNVTSASSAGSTCIAPCHLLPPT